MTLSLHSSLFFFNDTATTEIYTLSLHDALPISRESNRRCATLLPARSDPRPNPMPPPGRRCRSGRGCPSARARPAPGTGRARAEGRSEEHTSELQSPCNLVCRLLLEKKKKKVKSVDIEKNNERIQMHNDIIIKVLLKLHIIRTHDALRSGHDHLSDVDVRVDRHAL